jgi:DNA-binding CsgD family transcriptional regulator
VSTPQDQSPRKSRQAPDDVARIDRHAWLQALERGLVTSAARDARKSFDRLRFVDDPELRAHALARLGVVRLLGGASDGTSCLCAAMAIAGAPSESSARTSVAMQAGATLLWRGELASARTLLATALRGAERRTDPDVRRGVRVLLAELEQHAGSPEAALTHIAAAQTRQMGRRPPAPACWLEGTHASILAVQGREQLARALAQRALNAARSDGDHVAHARAARVLATLALWDGDPEAAVDHLAQPSARLRAGGLRDPGLIRDAPVSIGAALALGRLDRANSELERLSQDTSRRWHPWGSATVERCNGLVRAAQGATNEAAAALAAAAAAFAAIDHHFDAATATYELGLTLRAGGDPVRANIVFSTASDRFAACDASSWAIRAHQAAAADQPTVPSPSLTPLEQRVCGLAVVGQANDDIAARLRTTPAAVRAHLSRSYRKLGVRNRSELITALGPVNGRRGVGGSGRVGGRRPGSRGTAD